jgi:hypothetical protein
MEDDKDTRKRSVIMKHYRSTYASVGIVASYCADNI